MVNFITKNCSFCGNQYTPISSINKHCSHHCRFMGIASAFNGVDGCWEWPRSINVQTGYGQFMTNINGSRKLLTAHRLSYETFKGIIQENLIVLHKCDNKKCFNPNHLYLGTYADNHSDMINRGRGKLIEPMYGDNHWSRKKHESVPHGRRHHAAKLNEDIVKLARISNETSTLIAKKYGVSISTLCAARKGKTWKHVQ